MNRLHAIVLATVIGATTLAPGAAYATSKPHSQVHADSAKDVVSFDFSGSSETPTAEPTRTAGDIGATFATHAGHAVRMAIRLDSLISGADQGAYGFAVRTSKHRSYIAVLELAKGSSTRARAHLENGNGRQVRCRLAWDIVPSAKTVKVNVPRSCIGRPRWVRVGMGSVAQAGPKLYVDDARTKGASAATLDRFPIYGARLFH